MSSATRGRSCWPTTTSSTEGSGLSFCSSFSRRPCSSHSSIVDPGQCSETSVGNLTTAGQALDRGDRPRIDRGRGRVLLGRGGHLEGHYIGARRHCSHVWDRALPP